jgi:hypothetical protein
MRRKLAEHLFVVTSRANLLTIIYPLLRSEFELFQRPALAFRAVAIGSLTEGCIFSRAFHWASTQDAPQIPLCERAPHRSFRSDWQPSVAQ